MKDVGLVILTRNPGRLWKHWLEAFQTQTCRPEHLLLIDSSSSTIQLALLMLQGLRLHYCKEKGPETIAPVDYLISSGCLIPMSVLELVGGLRDDFFIDYIDIEGG